MASNWPARIAGGAAGLANGLFGGGGGMVFLPILSRFGTLEQRRLYATCVGVIFPVCAVSAAVYLWRGEIELMTALPYLIGRAHRRLAGRKALRKSLREAPEMDVCRLFVLCGGEVSAVSAFVLPFLCGLGAAVISAWGVGGRDAAFAGDDAVPRR